MWQGALTGQTGSLGNVPVAELEKVNCILESTVKIKLFGQKNSTRTNSGNNNLMSPNHNV